MLGMFNKNKAAATAPAGVGGVSFDSSETSEQEGVGAASEPSEGEDKAPEGQPVPEPVDGAGEDAVEAADTAGSQDPLAPAPTERKGRFGLGKAKSDGSKPAVLKVAKVKVKEPKPAPAPKALKPVREKRVKGEEETSLPITVVIDFYLGLSKEREAEQLARAQIEKNFDAPNAAYLYTQRWRDGIAVEIQEGGGKAYLPELLAKLDEDPDAIVALAMSNRFAQVSLDPDTKSLQTLLLTANQEPPEEAFIALPTAAMQPYDRRGSKVFMSGVALLAASSMAMIFAVGAFFIDTNSWALPYVAQTSVKDLPMAQSEKINAALQQPGTECVFKMEYANGAWNIEGGHDGGGVCAAGAAPIATPPVVDGSVPPGADAAMPGMAAPAGAPGTPGATATMPASPGAPPVFAAPAGAPGAPVAPGM
jgi:hypothetical protein